MKGSMIVVAVSGALAGALVTQLVAGRGRSAQGADRDRIAALERKLSALERRPAVAAPTRPPGAAAPIAAAAGDPLEAEAAGDPRAAAPAPPPNDRGASALAALHERLEERVRREPADAAWRPEAALAETLRAEAPEVRIAGTRCGTTLCKVEIILAGDDPQQLARRIGARPPFAAGTLYRHDLEATPPRAILYVARPGYDLDPGDS